jgi:hypothetical protein
MDGVRAVAAQVAVAQVIGVDEDDVGRCGSRILSLYRESPPQGSQKEEGPFNFHGISLGFIQGKEDFNSWL